MDICGVLAAKGDLNYFSLLRTRGGIAAERFVGDAHRLVHNLQMQLGCDVFGNTGCVKPDLFLAFGAFMTLYW